jgi:type II secretory ATPase GspE/PulE/Tfp pilus assembly ATPase PilB-like protein
MYDNIGEVPTLEEILDRIRNEERLEDIIFDLEDDIKTLVQGERMTLYRRESNGNEIVSWYGGEVDEEIRLALSPTSIAGYVAMSQQGVCINDVYDTNELAAIHQKLRFDYSYDQESGCITRAMITVPIKFNDTLLGVMQIMNQISGEAFTSYDLDCAAQIATAIAESFRYELKTTVGPYDYLIQSKKLTLEKLEELEIIAESEGSTVERLLTTECEMTVDEVGYSLEQYYQVPFFKYNPELELDNAVLDQLNKAYLAQNCWLPLAYSAEKAIILIDDPNDTDRIMEIQNVLSASSYEFLVGFREDIHRFLGFMDEEVLEEPDLDLGDLAKALEEENQNLGEAIEDNQAIELFERAGGLVSQLVSRVIFDAVEMGCSDIHIEPGKSQSPGIVRMRVDGVCRVVLEVPHKNMAAVVARVKVLSKLDITERRKPQDGKMAVKLGGRPLELRIATLPTVNGESVVARILAAGDALPFEKLGFTPRNYECVTHCLEHPHGIFMVVGPTGSGKTTSLHALLGHLNTPERKILTAEDPVEITQPGLQQVQVMPKIGYTFAMALRAFLRCDPDIILIGEMRDYETAHLGIEASLTGHLVFSTLHTNSAPETITRLLDMGLDPINFADALVGIVAQRLMRTLCGKCKEPYAPKQEEFDKLVHLYGVKYYNELGLDTKDLKLMKPVGCDICGGTGYRGRAGIHEVLSSNPEMAHLIATKGSMADIRELAMKQGMRTMRQDGIYKIFKGVTDLDQLRRVCAD